MWLYDWTKAVRRGSPSKRFTDSIPNRQHSRFTMMIAKAIPWYLSWKLSIDKQRLAKEGSAWEATIFKRCSRKRFGHFLTWSFPRTHKRSYKNTRNYWYWGPAPWRCPLNNPQQIHLCAPCVIGPRPATWRVEMRLRSRGQLCGSMPSLNTKHANSMVVHCFS